MSGHERWIKRARWLAVNVGVAAIAYYGVGGGVGWAANVLKFYLWFSGALTLLVALQTSNADVRQTLAKGPSVPTGLNTTWDLAVGLFLAAHGWFGYATLAALTGLLQGAAYSAAAKPPAEPATARTP